MNVRARMRLEVRPAGADRPVAVRTETNAVMRAGAELVSRLFAGQGTPITHIGVGTSSAPEDGAYTTAGLANDADGDIPPLVEPTSTVIPPDAFAFVTDETKRVARVRVRATLPSEAAIGKVREAGLLSVSDGGTVLYNRVTFAPVDKGDNHELTMFWEIEFPYGDLQWLL